jgi:hypothetical protein
MVLQYKTIEYKYSGYYYSFFIDYTRNNVMRNDSDPISHDYSVKRNQMGVYINFGYQTIKKNNFVIDQAIGFGVLFIGSKSINHFGHDDTQDFHINPYFFGSKNFNTGSKIFFSIKYIFLIGYKI